MKYLFTTIVMLCALAIHAQEFKMAHNGGKITLHNVDNATVTAYDGSEIVITANIHRNSDESARAKGLKAVNSLGLEDNTDMGLSVNKDGENVKVTQVGECMCNDNKGYMIKVPRSMGLSYEHSTYDSDDLKIVGLNQEIIISTNYTDIHLEDVTGPMSVKTVYGDIEAKFSRISADSSVSLNSVYGFVDAGIPGDSKANVSLRTPYGQIYTDFDIAVESSGGMREISDTRIKGTLNSGGVDLIIKSNYENIYLRKK